MPKISVAPVAPLTHDLRGIAALTGIPKSSLWPWLQSGELKSFKIGKKRYVKHTALLEFLDRMEAKVPQPATVPSQ